MIVSEGHALVIGVLIIGIVCGLFYALFVRYRTRVETPRQDNSAELWRICNDLKASNDDLRNYTDFYRDDAHMMREQLYVERVRTRQEQFKRETINAIGGTMSDSDSPIFDQLVSNEPTFSFDDAIKAVEGFVEITERSLEVNSYSEEDQENLRARNQAFKDVVIMLKNERMVTNLLKFGVE